MSEALQTRSIPTELAGLRLDQALARMFPEYSRSRLKEWLLAARLRWMAGRSDRVTRSPAAKSCDCSRRRRRVCGPIRSRSRWTSCSRTRICWSSTSLPDSSCIRAPAIPAGTLMNGLLHHAPSLEQVPRAGIIHRIDKDTSGLLLVAKTLRVAHGAGAPAGGSGDIAPLPCRLQRRADRRRHHQ